jgi:hypothetical protein
MKNNLNKVYISALFLINIYIFNLNYNIKLKLFYKYEYVTTIQLIDKKQPLN